MLSFVLVADVEMAGANCSSGEFSITVGFQGKTTVSPDVLKIVVDTLFEGCLGAQISPWIRRTSISMCQDGKRRKRGGYFPVREHPSLACD